jgi:hypothetical protein
MHSKAYNLIVYRLYTARLNLTDVERIPIISRLAFISDCVQGILLVLILVILVLIIEARKK